MIRRRQDGEFLLIAQDDHARLSGRLAEHLGNERIATLLPRKQVIDAMSMHDSGWPLHDDSPTLNRNGLPLHVFETPVAISTRVWAVGAQRATQVDPYTGLLVSLHVLALSASVRKRDSTPGDQFEHRHELFLLNQFQQDQIELQDNLRQKMGMRTDIPLRLGLANPRGLGDEREEWLAFHFGLVRLMDRISLELCCSEPLPWKIDALAPRPGAAPTEIRIARTMPGTVAIDPWPFSANPLEFQVPYRRVPATAFRDEQAFRDTFEHAPVEHLAVQVQRLGG